MSRFTYPTQAESTLPPEAIERVAFNLAAEFGPQFTLPLRKFAFAAHQEIAAALAPSAWTAGETAAWRDVLAERARQVEAEGWTSTHDDEHDAGDLAAAGSCYALSAAVILNPYTQGDGVEAGSTPPYAWPWEAGSWKIDRDNPRRALVKAAALLIAEIERIDRAAARAEAGQ